VGSDGERDGGDESTEPVQVSLHPPPPLSFRSKEVRIPRRTDPYMWEEVKGH
jgi:hypothetical protein